MQALGRQEKGGLWSTAAAAIGGWIPVRPRWGFAPCSWLGVAAAALLASPPGCAVNPVPTPQSAANGASDSPLGGGATAADAATVTEKDVSAVGFADVGGDAGSDAAPVPVTLATLEATATDAAISGGTHLLAWAPAVSDSGRLVVVVPDLLRAPTDYTQLAMAAARLGHRVLVLALAQTGDLAKLCAGSDACSEAARLEQFDGQDHTAVVAVSAADGLVNRLVKALALRAKAQPGERWGDFYSGAVPKWSQIAVVGHGDGAGEAAIIGIKQNAWRILLLAGPRDGQGDTPAIWLSGQHATPTANWRAFAHTKTANWARIVAAWTALGLGSGASAVSVDGAQTPGIAVQLLTTTMDVPDPAAGVAVDAALPSEPVALGHLQSAWKVLFWPF